jgi:hypothetical protein
MLDRPPELAGHLLSSLCYFRGAPKSQKSKEAIPEEAIPKKAIPKEEIPKEEIPREESPREESPKEASPKEASPKEAINHFLFIEKVFSSKGSNCFLWGFLCFFL